MRRCAYNPLSHHHHSQSLNLSDSRPLTLFNLPPAAMAALLLSLLLLWMALAPLQAGGRERLIAIPAGAAAAVAAGRADDGLPAAITLTLGVQDVLLLHNLDRVAHQFGPVLLAPGQQFRLPFEQAGVHPIAASAWGGKILTVTVVEWPAPGWERVKWRLAAFSHAVRYLPVVPRQST